jgi:antirestriction protein
MEQNHDSPGNLSAEPLREDAALSPPGIEELDLPPPAPESHDERVIREGIEAAVLERRPIDDRTARYIASQLHGGQSSALYSLASSGAVRSEVFAELNNGSADQPEHVRGWLTSLTVYCELRGESGPINGWVERAEGQDRADLMRRIAAAGVTTLGQIATVETAGSSAQAQADNDGAHAFHWDDAARWSPVDEVASMPIEHAERVNALFDGEPDEELGSVEELGWYGLIRHVDQAGGVILRLDEHGMRYAESFDDDAALTTRWAVVTNAYSEFYEQRDAYEAVTAEPETARTGPSPRIWVGSLADYNQGELHGAWFDATQEPDLLALAAKHLLRLGRAPTAEEWAVFDYECFGGAEIDEYDSFETVSRIAQGIVEHGEAFGHWAAYVGNSSTEQLERFEDHYLGEWDSFEGYIQNYLEEIEFYRFMELIPEDMHGYVEVDIEQIARDWSCDYHVVELENGHVGVFDTRA